MDILTFLSSIIDSLAWPGFIFGVIWFFRMPLAKLIDAIRDATFKYNKGDISVEVQLNTVREKAPSIEAQTPPQEVSKLVKSSPSEAIDRAWQLLEVSASAATSTSMPAPPLKIAEALMESQIFTPNEAEAFYKMYEIREEANKPHRKPYTDVSSASAYTDLAYGMQKSIEGSAHLKSGPATLKSKGEVTPKKDNDNESNKP